MKISKIIGQLLLIIACFIMTLSRKIKKTKDGGRGKPCPNPKPQPGEIDEKRGCEGELVCIKEFCLQKERSVKPGAKCFMRYECENYNENLVKEECIDKPVKPKKADADKPRKSDEKICCYDDGKILKKDEDENYCCGRYKIQYSNNYKCGHLD
jgi:hypothetical protein